jgi:hypothetical protein
LRHRARCASLWGWVCACHTQETAIIDLHVERMLIEFRKLGCRVPLRRVGPRRYHLADCGVIDLAMVDGRVAGVCHVLHYLPRARARGACDVCSARAHLCPVAPPPPGALSEGGVHKTVDLLDYLTATFAA